MRNSKWGQHIFDEEDMPSDWFEACVFLDHAFHHLRNRIEGPVGDPAFILFDARDKLMKERVKEAA